jgi:hypothetical protein
MDDQETGFNGQTTLRASELIELLQKAVAEHGDLRVWLRDPDTEWALGIKLDPEAIKLVRDYPELGPCMAIIASHYF